MCVKQYFCVCDFQRAKNCRSHNNGGGGIFHTHTRRMKGSQHPAVAVASTTKPWRTLNYMDKSCVVSSVHKPAVSAFLYKLKNETPKAPVEAFLLIQDGNIGGSYHRVISWRWGSDDSYFAITADGEDWIFDVPFADITTDDEGLCVTDTRTKQAYTVFKSEKYVKILEALLYFLFPTPSSTNSSTRSRLYWFHPLQYHHHHHHRRRRGVPLFWVS
jgi:hypothetical protein